MTSDQCFLTCPMSCNGCGTPLLLQNMYVDDGCPCNTQRGINFAPMPCRLCGGASCVKPAHRLAVGLAK